MLQVGGDEQLVKADTILYLPNVFDFSFSYYVFGSRNGKDDTCPCIN